MKRILLASVAALGLAGTASAADLAVKAPVAYAPAFTWTGCYLGANGGWIGGNDKYSVDTYPATGVFYSASSDDSAATLGGQFGCNLQLGAIVIGGEWDAAWSGLQESFSDLNVGVVSVDKSLDWFTTARVRLGLAFDRLLVYGTAGVAMGALDSETNIANVIYGGYRENRIGWTAGGGIEWAFSNSWTAKAEFLYLDFGSFDYNSYVVSVPVYTTHVDATEYVARIGLNYLFHPAGAPVVAKY